MRSPLMGWEIIVIPLAAAALTELSKLGQRWLAKKLAESTKKQEVK